jgi:hypothetical protein
MDPVLALLLVPAFLVAIAIMAVETLRSLQPASCDQCPHCQLLRVQRERAERERTEAYAREIGLDDPDRRNDGGTHPARG